jgi:hypothetical protein
MALHLWPYGQPLLSMCNVALGRCVVALLRSLQLDHGTAFAPGPVIAHAHVAAFGSAFAQVVRSPCCEVTCALYGQPLVSIYNVVDL